MTEDQSVVGRRRIYYDSDGNETLIASDSEEEDPGDDDDKEEPKHDFSKGEDSLIWYLASRAFLTSLHYVFGFKNWKASGIILSLYFCPKALDTEL